MYVVGVGIAPRGLAELERVATDADHMFTTSDYDGLSGVVTEDFMDILCRPADNILLAEQNRASNAIVSDGMFECRL